MKLDATRAISKPRNYDTSHTQNIKPFVSSQSLQIIDNNRIEEVYKALGTKRASSTKHKDIEVLLSHII